MNETLHSRYCAYMAGHGIGNPGDRAAELPDLAIGGVRFFAFAEGIGWRLKAALTPTGIVAPGIRAEDDWHGLLSAAPDAATAAARVAWLETDEAPDARPPIPVPVAVLSPRRAVERIVDPLHKAQITAPRLVRTQDGGVTLEAWFLFSRSTIPERLTISARPSLPAAIARAPASELAGPDDPTTRARKLLASGSPEETIWALSHLGVVRDREGVPDIVALLASGDPTLRREAVFALHHIADPAAVPALAQAACLDPDVDVRLPAVQALGRIGGDAAAAGLAEAAAVEPDTAVRLEVVHALAALGSAAEPHLKRIAKKDSDRRVRELARGYARRR